jgi:vacuolar-type H+-ATPase subunit E/Vma4
MFSRLFGGKKEVSVSKKTEDHTNQTISKMQDTQELLEKRQKLLQKKMDQEQEKAKQFLAKKDKKCLLIFNNFVINVNSRSCCPKAKKTI